RWAVAMELYAHALREARDIQTLAEHEGYSNLRLAGAAIELEAANSAGDAIRASDALHTLLASNLAADPEAGLFSRQEAGERKLDKEAWLKTAIFEVAGPCLAAALLDRGEPRRSALVATDLVNEISRRAAADDERAQAITEDLRVAFIAASVKSTV